MVDPFFLIEGHTCSVVLSRRGDGMLPGAALTSGARDVRGFCVREALQMVGLDSCEGGEINTCSDAGHGQNKYLETNVRKRVRDREREGGREGRKRDDMGGLELA